MWSIIAAVKSINRTRAERGTAIILKLRSTSKTRPGLDSRKIANVATKLADSLIRLCNHDIIHNKAIMSLTADFRFPISIAPCELVIPLQSLLTMDIATRTTAESAIVEPFPPNQPTVAGNYSKISQSKTRLRRRS
jgi:serine/threonine-protein kinase ATR